MFYSSFAKAKETAKKLSKANQDTVYYVVDEQEKGFAVCSAINRIDEPHLLAVYVNGQCEYHRNATIRKSCF